MNLINRIEFWGEHHHPRWMDIIRIALGIFLIYKGIDDLENMSLLLNQMSAQFAFGSFAYILAVHYAVLVHVLGGIFLTLGLFTRMASLIQIPVLIGAIIFVNASPQMLRPYSELFLSIIVLMLLIYFLIAGNGPWAVKLTEPPKRSKPN
jgi:uncharacterized membrane protein YphA (DoxX/SURF4 family)